MGPVRPICPANSELLFPADQQRAARTATAAVDSQKAPWRLLDRTQFAGRQGPLSETAAKISTRPGLPAEIDRPRAFDPEPICCKLARTCTTTRSPASRLILASTTADAGPEPEPEEPLPSPVETQSGTPEQDNDRSTVELDQDVEWKQIQPFVRRVNLTIHSTMSRVVLSSSREIAAFGAPATAWPPRRLSPPTTHRPIWRTG
eukprot:SAG25_NODE_1059_length_4155_cov_2.069034_7_plen_204_part_00